MCRVITTDCPACWEDHNTKHEQCAEFPKCKGTEYIKGHKLCLVCWHLAKWGYVARRRKRHCLKCVWEKREDEVPEFDHDTICQCGRKDILLEPESLAAKVFAEQPSPYVMSGYREILDGDKHNRVRKDGRGKRRAKDHAGLKRGENVQDKSKVLTEDDTKDQVKSLAKDGVSDDAESQPVDASGCIRMDEILIE